ncbi:hypothetical protein FKP32DRAFT_1761416 [Trametes sanguinea]|nr:hypothetical protein FKP32DRAFT_1761416 [Trametes sanguinea]
MRTNNTVGVDDMDAEHVSGPAEGHTIPRKTILESEYSKSSKELITFIGQLRALGAHVDIELPRIVVIGNQSAGKSSLVEAISGISVPRDAGTCTRCPMECRLCRSDGEWSCQVKIRYEYDDDSCRRLEEIEEIDFEGPIFDKNEVENALRRAQAEVLRGDRKKSLKFSRNVVCLELTGPDLCDLSFVDLPGIVQNADTETVQLVEDLVNSYIKGSSLILVTLPVSDDIENQKAARLAHLADPEGLRTIGVLTKPDTLASGSKARDTWLEVLEGRRHPLLHGYYCTRQPDDDERAQGISGASAREIEAKFFKKTKPWSRCKNRERLGTENLVQSISKLLTQIIRESLPTLLGKVASQLELCTEQLAVLPPPISTEPSAYVLALVTSFASELRARIHGGLTEDEDTELVQRTRDLYEKFKKTIRATAPPFVPFQDARHAPKDISEFVQIDHSVRSTRRKVEIMYLDDVRRRVRKSVTRELPGNVPYSVKISLIRAFQRDWENAAMDLFQSVQATLKDAIMQYVRQTFDRHSGLNAIVGPVITRLLNSCTESTAAQVKAVLALESSPFTQNGHYLSECREKWLAKYKEARRASQNAMQPEDTSGAKTDRKRTLDSVSEEPLPKRARAEDGSAIPARNIGNVFAPQQVYDHESEEGTGSEYDDDECESSSEEGGDACAGPDCADEPVAQPAASDSHDSRDRQEKENLVKDALATLAKLGYSGLTAEDLGKLNKADEYNEELELMAEVRAYFQVAYKRVIDNVPLMIDHNYMYAFAAKLHQSLFEGLGLGADNVSARCRSYIAEDPSIVTSREELMSKKKRLENVQKALFNFGL